MFIRIPPAIEAVRVLDIVLGTIDKHRLFYSGGRHVDSEIEGRIVVHIADQLVSFSSLSVRSLVDNLISVFIPQNFRNCQCSEAVGIHFIFILDFRPFFDERRRDLIVVPSLVTFPGKCLAVGLDRLEDIHIHAALDDLVVDCVRRQLDRSNFPCFHKEDIGIALRLSYRCEVFIKLHGPLGALVGNCRIILILDQLLPSGVLSSRRNVIRRSVENLIGELHQAVVNVIGAGHFF